MKNRILKFRAWDKKALKMSPEFNLFGEFTLLGGVHAWQYESNIKGDSLGRLNDLEIMAFTGLLDKHGKEIYEGDIVIAYNSEQTGYDSQGEETYQDTKGKVIFEDGYFQYDGHSMGPIPLSWDLTGIEVIGNAYENPELIEGVENKNK